MMGLSDIISEFSKLRVLVVGDPMLDRYVFGSAERMCPEAPVPVLRVEAEEERLGGAAHVLANVVGMGAKAAFVGVVGGDEEGERLSRMIIETGAVVHLVKDKGRATTVKTRIWARGQYIVRIDREEMKRTSEVDEEKVVDFAVGEAKWCDAVIISDYAKGVITKRVVSEIVSACSCPVIVDPKPVNLECYYGATFMTPNESDAIKMAGVMDYPSEEVLVDAGVELLRYVKEGVVITRGSLGSMLVMKGLRVIEVPPMRRRCVYDVVGAGDAFVAAFSLAIAAGASPEDAARIGNLAGGIEVTKLGASPVSRDELLSEVIG